MDNTLALNPSETKTVIVKRIVRVKNKAKARERRMAFAVIIFKLLADLFYLTAIVKNYSYYGLNLEVNALRIVVGYLFFFLILLRFTVKHIFDKRPSSKLMLFFEIMYFIPGTTFFTFAKVEPGYVFFFIAFYILMLVALHFGNKLIKDKRLVVKEKVMEKKKKIFDIFIITLLVITVFYLLYYNGFQIKFDLSDVYKIRLQVRDMDIPTIINYLRNPTAILIPILLFICLKEKKIVKAIILIIIQLAMYAFGANKINLLSIALAIALAIVSKKQVYAWIFLGLCAILIFGMIYFSINGHLDSITDILIRRTMFTPHKMGYDYFTCFSKLEPDYWRSSFLRFFGVQSPYGEITYFIGKYNGTFSNCDNGLVGDAFGNFGYWSLFIYPFLFFAVFITYNLMCRGIKEEIIIFLSFMYVIVFYDAPFFTVMLTHGYIFMFLFFVFLYPYRYGVIKSKKPVVKKA